MRKKIEISLMFFPRGGGHTLEEMCRGQGHGNKFPPGNQSTLPGTSFHPAALGASAGLLNLPLFLNNQKIFQCVLLCW